MNGSNSCWPQAQHEKHQNKGKSVPRALSCPPGISLLSGIVNAAVAVNKEIGQYTAEGLKSHFKTLVKKNTVLGSAGSAEQTDFVTTPILKELAKCSDMGVVSVAMVPEGQGKTMVTRVFLERYGSQVRDIVFCCAQVRKERYKKLMRQNLQLKADKIPEDWLTCLMEAFHSREDKRPAFLILDGIPCEKPTNKTKSLIVHLADLAKDKPVRVIVMTPTNEVARSLLQLGGRGVVPPNDAYSTVRHEWKNMHWSVETIKDAAISRPALKDLNQPGEIITKIGEYLEPLTENEKKVLQPLDVFRMLEKTLVRSRQEVNIDRPEDKRSDSWCGLDLSFGD